MTATTGQTEIASKDRASEYFYFYMAVACALVAFLGFAPTYWLPLLEGTLAAHPIIHIHGLVFFVWSLFLVTQTWLAASRRIARHRTMGLVGISIATAMTIFGLMTAINRMHAAAALGLADAGKSFAIVPIAAILFFAVTFGFAVANIRRPEWHKRLMLVAAVSILDAPIARWFITFLAPPGPPGPPPVAVDIGPSLVALLLLLFAMSVDYRRLGRPHTAYIAGVGAFVALKALQVPVSETALWHGFAGWLMTLAG